MLTFILIYFFLSWTVLYCIVLYCIVLSCTVLFCTVLFCAVLYCPVLFCPVLYCSVNDKNRAWNFVSWTLLLMHSYRSQEIIWRLFVGSHAYQKNSFLKCCCVCLCSTLTLYYYLDDYHRTTFIKQRVFNLTFFRLFLSSDAVKYLRDIDSWQISVLKLLH